MKQFFNSLGLIGLLLSLPPAASGQSFGKNNVQYTNFDWHFIQSKHFDVYFYPGSAGIAEFVADVAESSYVSLSTSWNYKLKDRIVIIVYKSHNDFGQTNLNFGPPEESVGGFTEFFKNRVAIPYEGSYEQLRHVTHHELTHAIMLQMLFGARAHAILSGISRSNIPLWFIEGLAEYQSRGWDAESDMFIRDAVISGYMPPIDYLYAFLAYKGGQSLFDFIAKKYGRRKVGELLTKVKYTKNVESGLQQSIGTGIKELSEQWHKYLKKIYWPDFANRQEPGDFAKQITFHETDKNFINNSGELSPQGDKIAFLSDKSGFFDIYMASTIDGEQNVKLVSGQRTGKLEELHWLRPGITWSPDGKKIAFAAKSREQDAIHIVDVRRKKIVKSHKFNLDGIYSPDWSPNGDEIAFVGTYDGFSDICVYNLATDQLRKLNGDVFSDLAPQWSPDGKQIAFISDRTDFLDPAGIPADFKIQNFDYHQFDVYTIDLQTNKLARLTTTSANEKSPVWSPDGSKIAFISDRNGISNIYIKVLRSNDNRKTTLASSQNSGESARNGNGHAPPEGRSVVYPITNVLTGIDHLSWEGQRLAFTSFYKGGFDIFLIKDPLRVQAGDVELSDTNYVATRKQKQVSNTDSGERPDHEGQGSDSEAREYSRFVFGEEFKKGQPLSAHAPKPDLFLNEKDYKVAGGGYRVNAYRTKFSADIIAGGAGYDPFFGFQGASILSFSDMMGNHRINILTDVFVDIKNSDFALSYFHLPRQTDYGVGIFQFNYLFFSRGRFLVRDRNIGLNVSLSRPFDRYRRLEFGLSFRNISRDGLVDFSDSGVEIEGGSRRVILSNLNYVKDNVIWGLTGPKAGSRFNFSIQASPDLGANGLDFRVYQFDYRTYLNFKRNYTFAIRLSAGMSEGRQKQKFFLGGMYNWINLDFRNDVTLDLDDIYFSNFVTPLRGFDYYEQLGSKFFLSNLELRIPFINFFDMSWPLPMRFSNIRGAVFLDVGSAWDSDFGFFTRTAGGGLRLDDVLMSFGWGTRLNAGIFLLKYDLAWRTDLDATSKPRHLFSIGADF